MGRRDDRRPTGHRLGDRHAEALVARRVDHHRSTAIEPRELVVVDAAEAHDAGTVELRLLTPALPSDDDECEVPLAEERPRLGERAEVLARLERRDRQYVRLTEVGGVSLNREL